MNYEELNRLWQEQRNADEKWRTDLNHAAVDLHKSVVAELSPPCTTNSDFNTGAQHRYIDILDIYKQSKPQNRLPGNESITTDGVLVFAIGVTFDWKRDAFPKQQFFAPVACRFDAGKLQYGFFDRDTEEPEGDWTVDVNAFAKKIIARLEKWLKHDPYEGFGNRVKIGFSQL